MKGRRMIGTSLALILLCCGCQTDTNVQQEDVLYQQGTALIGRIRTLAEEEAYWQLMMNTSPEIQEIINEIQSQDTLEPRAVFSVGFPKQAVDALLAQWEGEDPAVEEELGRRLFASVPAQLTGMGGSLRLAASSVLSAGDCFVLQGLQEPQMYLYLYDGDWPAAVLYQPGQDGAVTASASFFYEPKLREVSTQEQFEGWKEEIEYLAGGLVEQIQ